MARDIVADAQSRPLTCLCVLKVRRAAGPVPGPTPLPPRAPPHLAPLRLPQGGHQFFADLFNEIKALNVASDKSVPLRVDFIR